MSNLWSISDAINEYQAELTTQTIVKESFLDERTNKLIFEGDVIECQEFSTEDMVNSAKGRSSVLCLLTVNNKMIIRRVLFVVNIKKSFDFVFSEEKDDFGVYDMDGKPTQIEDFKQDGIVTLILKITKIIRQLNPVD